MTTRNVFPWALVVLLVSYASRLRRERNRARHDARTANAHLDALIEDWADDLVGSVFGD